MKSICCAIILSMGVVDKIEEEIVTAEIVDKDDSIHYIEMTMAAFPCEIKEQQKFYFIYDNGMLTIRCTRP